VPGDEPHALDDGEMALWTAFLQAALLALDEIGRALAPHDLTLDDYEILVFLSAEPERQLAMSDLADRTLSAKSRLTYRVDRLEKGGFVRRVRCGQDGRRVWATLTPEGFALLETSWPAHLASVRRFVVDPVEARDRVASTRALEAMIDALHDAKHDE
jgi:DNA-binding MarR family transcriptional regulator